MNTQFQNKFGRVSFRLVAAVTHVGNIRGANLDARCMFDIETAEKIALITENRGIQIAPFNGADGWRCYVILHETESTAAVAEIEELTYTGDTPAQELHAARDQIGDGRWVA